MKRESERKEKCGKHHKAEEKREKLIASEVSRSASTASVSPELVLRVVLGRLSVPV